jgi:hypothetical protein
MTPDEIAKMDELVLATAEVNSFLKGQYNAAGSLRTFDHSPEDAANITASTIVAVSLTDLKHYTRELAGDGSDDHSDILTVYLPRWVIMRALAAELERLKADEYAMGVVRTDP